MRDVGCRERKKERSVEPMLEDFNVLNPLDTQGPS